MHREIPATQKRMKSKQQTQRSISEWSWILFLKLLADFTTIYRKQFINTLNKIWKCIDNLERTSLCHYSAVTSKVLSNSISFNRRVDNYRAKGLMWLRVSGFKKMWRKYRRWKWMKSLSIIFCRHTWYTLKKTKRTDTTDHTSLWLQCAQYTADFAFLISSTDSSKGWQ